MRIEPLTGGKFKGEIKPEPNTSKEKLNFVLTLETQKKYCPINKEFKESKNPFRVNLF